MLTHQACCPGLRRRSQCEQVASWCQLLISIALASYTGLTPIVRSSGESVWTGGITRLGYRALRHALVEASINAVRKSPELNRMLCRILYRSNVQKAQVAVARKLAVIIYAMLRRSEPFRLETA
ncbi:MAG TPA: transposase [Acidobacteriota bacterium]|nr:transposase [Acidobacteriota bacterium]